MKKYNTTIEKAFSFLKEKGIYGLSYFKLLGITDNDQIKRILHKAESQGIIKLPISLVENTWLPPSDTHGWGNGYVFLDETHPAYGLSYGDIHLTDRGGVPGGITYSEWSNHLGEDAWDLESGKYWVVGFDTAHSFNNETHNQQWVYDHTLNFLIDLYTNLS